MVNIIKYRKIYYTISGTLFVLSIAALLIWGLKFGLDFTGGTLFEINFKENRPAADEIVSVLSQFDLGNINIQPTGENDAIFRLKDIDEKTHQEIISKLEEKWPIIEKRFESVGPTIGNELRQRAYLAVILAIIMIVLYISLAFRKVSWPVSSWKYGLGSIFALIHDVAIPLGIFSALGHFKGVEVDALFITALLTVLGFSIHDTIVVYDRIRENLKKGGIGDFETTVNFSINQTFIRSINTSLTVLLVLFAIFIFGGETIKYFSLALIVGIIFGTYSSIFLASPFLVTFEKIRQKEIKKK